MAVREGSGLREVGLPSLVRRNCRGEMGDALVCPAAPNPTKTVKHAWKSQGTPGDALHRCSDCGALGVYRTTHVIKVPSDPAVNARLSGFCMPYRAAYDHTILYLCSLFVGARRLAQDSADAYADKRGWGHYMATKTDLGKTLPNDKRLKDLVKVWRDGGVLTKSVPVWVQRGAAVEARKAFLAKYDTHRKAVSDNARLKKRNDKKRAWNKESDAAEAVKAGSGAKKKRVRHPSRSMHRNLAIDMTRPDPMLYGEDPPERMMIGAAAPVRKHTLSSGMVKIDGLPELALCRAIPGAEKLDVRTVQFSERTRAITPGIRPEQRTWNARVTSMCLAPEPPDEDDDIAWADSTMIDPGCINHIATSEGVVWSAPSPNASNRKIKNHQRHQSQAKNGSRKHKHHARKAKKERDRKTRRRQGAKAQKSAEISKEFDEAGGEGNKPSNMIGSAKGTIGAPGVGVAAKTQLNNTLSEAALGETLGLLAAACHNHGALFYLGASHYNSQTCSRCGHIDENNRPERDLFLCLECGHTANADADAALVGKQKRFAEKQETRTDSKRLALTGENPQIGGGDTLNPARGEGASSSGTAVPRRVTRTSVSTAPRADTDTKARPGPSPHQSDSQPASALPGREPKRQGADPPKGNVTEDVAHTQ